MFPSLPLPPRHLRQRQQNYAWDSGYIYSTSHSLPSLEDFSLSHSPAPIDLPSRVSALNRRAAIVSANLAHLTAVVAPLESAKPEDLTDVQLSDMWQESVALGNALEEFRGQMEEVGAILEELLGERKRERRWVVFAGRGEGRKGGERRRALGI